MATADILARSFSSKKSKPSWGSMSNFNEVWQSPEDVSNRRVDEEEELGWAAIERLPTYDRLRRGMLRQVLENGRVVIEDVDVTRLGMQDKKVLMESILKVVENDNERFLKRLRSRIDRVGIEIPKIEARYEHLLVEGDVYVGSRALPTLLNATLNTIESVLGLIRLAPSKKKNIQILKEVSGIVRPSRMTLLLGPPGAGKTTLLLALAGKLGQDLRVSGNITYCGHKLNEFVSQRTCAYISEHDLNYGEMTVRETLDFSGRCLGVGSRYDLLAELSRREKDAGIQPDPEIDAFMKATSFSGQKTSLVTDYVLKILGLDICADTMVGNDIRRGISGGQKKRVTTGEMLVGPAKVLLMDEISTGLDSATTWQICWFMRQMVHIMDVTMVISLLQPAPETFELFDDLILLSEGHIVYQGPQENVLEFFGHMGFKCPERKGVADFLQEVTSKKDQEQYWFRKSQPYRYISVPEFVESFRHFKIGQQIASELSVPYDKSRAHPAALVTEKYGIPKWELFMACFSRELLLMKRNSFMYIFNTAKIAITALIVASVFPRTQMPVGTIQDGRKFIGALIFSCIIVMFNGIAEMPMIVFKLPVFYKQRDLLFYPGWAFGFPIWVLRVPESLVESGIWVILSYYTVGYAPAASRFFKQFLAYFSIHQMALSLFRFIAVVGRIPVVASTLSSCIIFLVFVLGGFIVPKNQTAPWMRWGYYFSPMMYGQNALVMNEFLDERWSMRNPDPRIDEPTVGKVLLKSIGSYTEEYWFWINIGALYGFSLLFNILFIASLTFLNPLGGTKTVITDEESEKNEGKSTNGERISTEVVSTSDHAPNKGMVLPFQPLSLVFNHVDYYIDMPAEMKSQGIGEERLRLLRDVSGAFRPGILTALVGVSGAGKTTLMDVLAGRKTGGYIEGSINISGYPKNQETFARVSGYCEQNDIHSPHVTVYESLLYSAWLRLSSDVKTQTRKMFVEEIMELVELTQIRDALVGLPGIDGLSTEQRKRLTIAVELVSNPSIIFMDEPTSGLDSRAAAIVMRTVRSTVDTGRTVVCTIHQPSIDIFEAFDELLLMKRGGQIIYAGPLGSQAHKLVEYFEAVPGVSKIKDGSNPSTWMLEVTAPSVEAQLDVDFAEIYANSSLYMRNQELIKELSTPVPGSKDLYFQTKYSQPFLVQCKACFWKMHWSYWRNPQYNAIRFFITIVLGVVFGVIFWNKGQQTTQQQDLITILGAMYTAVLFLGTTICSSVQSAVGIERTVFYREKAAKMYSELPYAFAQVAIETIYVAIQALVYTLLLYPMFGFEYKITNFLWFFYYMLMCFVYYALFGMMSVALTPSLQIASVGSSFFYTFWNLLSGFIIPRPQMPVWWRWYYWGSPVSWTLYGIVTSQVGTKNVDIVLPGNGTVPLKKFLKDNFGYDYDFLPIVAAAHIGWVLLFLFVFAYGIKFLNFQRR